jgi:sugar lactone lactonase YvrE
MHRRLAGLIGLTFVVVLAIPGAAPVRATPGHESPRLIASLPSGDYGSFAESLAVGPGGSLYTSLTTWSPDEFSPNEGQIWRIGPDGKLRRFGPTLDVCLMTGLAFGDGGRLYAGTYSCDVDFTLPSGVLEIDARGATRVLTLPAGTFPNGLAFHRGELYVSDPLNGTIWRVRPQAKKDLTPTAPWFQDPLLGPDDTTGLGVNGLAFRGNTLYAVNYGTGSVIAIPIRANGSAGTPTVVASDPSLVTADGVAFDVHGRLWVTLNSGGVARIDRDGNVSIVLDDPAWLDYPVQGAFGTTGRDRTTLYVANGSLAVGTPNVVAFDIGVAGERLP